jgi:hypothetical protein
METTDLRSRAVRVALQRLQTAHASAKFVDEPAGYLADWRDNVIEGISTEDVERDLHRASGNELEDGPRAPAKFKAAYSSCALVVNTFGPFRHAPGQLSLAGICDFTSVQFEVGVENGLRGGNPTCDLVALTPASVVAVESKFLEPLMCAPADLSPQYAAAFLGAAGQEPVAERAWSRMYHRLSDDPNTYRHLDAAQLVKHYLGLMHSFPRLERTLFYLYWEPVNASDLSAYRDFRREITDFALSVADCDTRFVAKSYRAQLQEWQHNRARLDLTAHLERLRRRYEFAI